MARSNCFWGTSVTENLDSDYWTQLAAAEAGQARKFMSVRKNYGPDNVPVISAALQRVWTEGRKFQYQNGKPGPKAPDTGTSGTYWASVAAGSYDSIYIAFFEAVANAGMWTNKNPLAYSFHHEQYVISEGGGANYGSAADYIAFHRHLYNLLVNGSGSKGPWHVSQGGNIRVAFVPHWRQFYGDPTYGLVAASGKVVGYTFTDLNPGSSYYEILGADIYCYQNDSFTADQQWGPVRAAALAMGKPFITGETGVAAEKGDSFVVTYLKRLDTLFKQWGAGDSAGEILAINWTDRVVKTPGSTTTSDLRLTASNVIQAQFKSMAQDAFYGAGLDGDFTIDASGSGGGTAPTITSFSPNPVVVGASVVVTGTNFTGATAVKVNGVNATSFVNSNTQITLVVPSTTSGKITVTQGTTATSTATLTIVSAPTITSFTPSSGIAGDSIVVTGTNLSPTTAVTVNGTAAAFRVDSATQVTLTIPAGATTGKIGITAAGVTVLSASNLTVTTAATPTITSFTPSSGAIGATVTITGTNFTGANSVKVNGTSAQFTVVNSTTITFAIPNGATTGTVFVGVPGTPGVTSGSTLTVTGTGGGTESFVRVLDKQAPVGTATTLVLTIPTGGVPVGHSIIIVAGSNHVAITGITDTRGNTYQSDASATPSTFLSGAIYSANVTTALLAGDTITITYASTVAGRCAIATEYQYFLTSSYADAPVAASGSDTSLTLTSATLNGAAQTASGAEVVISGVLLGGSGASAGTISVGSGWNLRDQIETASGTRRAVALAGRQLSKAETPSVTWTWGVNDGYLELIAAYKIQLPGPGGGSGVAPQIRQSTSIFPTAPQATGSLTIPAWSQPVLAGSRIVVEVGITNNQNDGIGAAISGGQYTLTSQSPAVRRTNPSGAGAHDQVSIRQFQRLNVPAGAAAPTIAFTGLPGSGVYVWAVAHEVTGSHLTLAEDPIAAANATGSSATPTVAAPGPSSRDAILYLASFACGNTGTPTPDGATGFANVVSGDSAGATSTAKAAGAVLSQPQTAVGATASATVDIPGGLSHNYAALLLAIPAPDTTTSGGLMGLDATDDGRIHRHTPLQYWPAGIAATAGGNTALQNAQLLASQSDIIVANVKETDSAAGTIQKDSFHGLADDMRLVKANIALAPYCKSAQIDEGATYFPNTYYAHVVPWPSGAKLTTFSNNIYIAQPSAPGQPVFASPRGFNASSFADYRAKDANHTLATYNTLNGAGTLNAIFRDSCGPTTYKNQADPLNPTSTYPTRDSWLKGQVYTILDADLARTPNTLLVANGLVSGPAYFNGLSALLAHSHVGVAENFLRNNYTPFTDSSWPSEIEWRKDVDMLVDANVNQGRGVACITNIANTTAGGSAPSGYVAWTTAQINQARRFTLGTYMLGNSGASWVCFVPDAPATMPWVEDDPWYHVALGAPLDNPATDATGQGAALSLKTSEGVYQRRFKNGSVYVNPTNATVTFHLDRTYYNVASDGSRGTLYGNVGDQKTLGKYDALILYGTAPSGTNSAAPTVTIKTPLTGSTVNQATITTTATITDLDGDGIASAQARVGAGTWFNATLNGGVWSCPLTLSVGANTVSWRATDDNASPLTSTPVSVTVTYTVVTPTAPVNVTPPSIPQVIAVGDTITLNPGTWTSSLPVTYLYTLQSRPKAGGTFVPIYIDSDPTYVVQPSDQDMVFDLVVVANNGADSLPATSNVSDPVQPASTVAFSATLQSDQGRVQLTIDAPATARLYTITRQHPSGRVITVRGCDQAALSGGSAIAWDYEIPIGIPVAYQATIYSDADTQQDQSDTITITWTTSQTWLKDPLEPTRNMPVTIRDMTEYTYDHRAGVHIVLGRPDPVVVGDIRSAAAGTVTFYLETKDEVDRFQYLASSGRALLLQDDQDSGIGNMYLAALSSTEDRVLPFGPRRFFAIDYQEVRSPEGDGASFVTWADVVAQFPDWQAVIDAYADWGSLLEGLGSTATAPTLTWRGA